MNGAQISILMFRFVVRFCSSILLLRSVVRLCRSILTFHFVVRFKVVESMGWALGFIGRWGLVEGV